MKSHEEEHFRLLAIELTKNTVSEISPHEIDFVEDPKSADMGQL